MRLFIILVFSIIIAACGGGGNGGENNNQNIGLPILAVTSVGGSSIITNQNSLPVFGSTSPGATVTVNGISVNVDVAGGFSTNIILSLGDNTITVVADLAGQQATFQFIASLQQTPPTLSITSPAPALSTNASNLQVIGSTELSGTSVWVNSVKQTLTNGDFSTSITLSPGVNLVHVVAVDAAGNETVIDRSVTLDQTKPLLSISNPVDGSTIYTEPLYISGHTEAGVSVTINGNSATLTPQAGELSSFYEQLVNYEPTSNIAVVATDLAGNTTTINLVVNRFASPGTIYVSKNNPNAADISNCGTVAIPCLTIAMGLNRALAVNATQVLVSQGIYQEKVTLQNGVNLLGGFDDYFSTRNLSIFTAEIWGDGTSHSVVVSDLTASTLLEGFVIRGSNMTLASSNSVALFIKNTESNLVVQNNTIYSGTAANGNNGLSGSYAQNGLLGLNGADFWNPVLCSVSDLASGGAAQSFIVGSTNISGGDGGGNIACPTANETQVGAGVEISGGDGNTGMAGGGLNGTAGLGGDAGDDGALFGVGQCVLSSSTSHVGADGTDGQDGTHGSAGTGGGSGFSIISDSWFAAVGSDATAGSHGGGGGGGGAGGGALCVTGTCTNDMLGGTGGAGGSGGEGGAGGTGGGGGGASFGVFITYSSIPASLPDFTNNLIYLGSAGDGGSGGWGGVAGQGGSGGTGGVGDFCAWSGGVGGNGGQGGQGGGAGGGAGGISAGIYLNLVGYTGGQTYNADNNINTSTGVAGEGGSGGYSYYGGNSGTSGLTGSVNNVAINP